MYPVSSIFQMLMQRLDSTSTESAYGTLSLRNSDGIVTYNFDENAIIQGSLVIKDQLGDGKFGFGGAYIRNMSVKIDCDKIEGLSATNINLTNAEIEIWYRLNYNRGQSQEDVYMGKFYIDSRNSSRKFQILSLIGEDCLSKFDVTSVAMASASPYEVYATACGLAGVEPLTAEEVIGALPNGSLSLTFDTSQIQTARDMLMWVAKLTGTIARVKRQSEQGIELVQIPTKYTTFDIPGLFDLDTFKEDNGTIIGKDSTYRTEYTDTSVRILTLLTDYKGERLSKGWHYTADNPCSPDLLEGTMEIESNPLLAGKTSSEVETALGALQDYTQHLRMTPFKVEFTGNPAIEIGDFVYLQPGGVITDNFRHYGIVTYHRWVFNGNSEIRCDYSGAAQRPYYTTSEASEVSTFAATSASSEEISTVESVQPKSQFEKRLEKTSEAGDAEAAKYLKTNGGWYLFPEDSEYENTRFLSFGPHKTAVENRADKGIDIEYHGGDEQNHLKFETYFGGKRRLYFCVADFGLSVCYYDDFDDSEHNLLGITAGYNEIELCDDIKISFNSREMTVYNKRSNKYIHIPFTDE